MNSSHEQKKRALIEEITAAFDGVSRENGVSFRESRVIDDYGSDEERAKARSEDTETRWQDVPDDDIYHAYACLSFLDEIGFHYYIPAFVVWFLRYMDTEDPDFASETSGSLIYHLNLSDDEILTDLYLSRYKFFTHEQSKAIAHFLEFVEEQEDAFRKEDSQRQQQRLSDEGLTPEEIDAHWREVEEYRVELDVPDNEARRALDRYWRQWK